MPPLPSTMKICNDISDVVDGFVVKVSDSLHYLKCLTLQDTFEGLVWVFFQTLSDSL